MVFTCRINTYLISQNNDGLFLVFTVVVAAFLGFVQNNVIGPPLDLPLLFGDVDKEDIEIWARNEVMSSGSDLNGKFVNLEYLVYAKLLLMVVRDFMGKNDVGFVTCSWWLVRVLLVEQKILDGHSSVLFQKLRELCSECLDNLSDLEKVRRYWDGVEEGVLSDVVAMVYLECGIVDFRYGRVDSAKGRFEMAKKVSGWTFEVSGAMGFRTVHQVDPKAQLRLLADNLSLRDGGEGGDGLKHDSQLREASDILLTPRFLEENEGSGGLKPIQQALILGQCLIIEKNTPHYEMQRWDMAPYIEAIDSQAS